MDAAPGLPALPPAQRVHAVLGITTERLASELACPRSDAPFWSSFEWGTARAVSAMHGISGLLAQALRWQGPREWQEFLAEQRTQITARHGRLEELLEQVSAELSARGIAVVALKGAALHRAGLYRPGERPMADLDLLVAPPDVEAASAALEPLGFREAQRTVKHRIFTPCDTIRSGGFGEHADNDLKIELHERICEFLPLYATDITALIFPRRAAPGLNPYPSRSALMAHLLLHASGGVVFRTLRLVQLNDIAVLARTMSAADWQLLIDWQPWWALPVLALTERYYGPVAPRVTISAAARLCPHLLRRRSARQRISDVSLSRLWVDAFPGLEWARSPREALHFIARRIVPSAQVRRERVSGWYTEPSLREGDWARLSQSRRVARFLLGRTPRPWPLYNLRAALSAHDASSGDAFASH
jgi:hypothetical protein